MTTLGPWEVLDGGYGATVAVAGEYTVAAQLGYLTAWARQRLVALVAAPAPAPGRPRVVVEGDADRVYWGAGVLSLATGALAPLTGLAAETTGPVVPRSAGHPAPGPTAATYAWSPDGSAVVVTAQHAGGPNLATASAVLRDASGRLLARLWEGSDVAPRAAWAGRTLLAVGTAAPQVFRPDGSRVGELAGVTPAVRIEASGDEARLLVVEHGQLTLWDTATWARVGSAPGQWLDADLAPDGQLVIAVDFAGALHALDGALAPAKPVALPEAAHDTALGVALDDNRVVAAFSGEVRTAALRDRG